MSISFGLSFLESNKLFDLIGFGLTFLLALTTKKAAFLAIPVFAILVLLWLISIKIKSRKMIPWISSGVIVLIISIIIWVGQVSIRNNGFFAGVQVVYDTQTTPDLVSAKAQYNSSRYLYQFIGLDGLPRFLQKPLVEIKANIFKNMFNNLGLDLEKEVFLQPGYDEVEKFDYLALPTLTEEFTWFGPLGFLLLPLALVISLFSQQKIRRRYAVFVLALFVSFFVLVLFQRPGWDPYQGRYFILSVLPIVPLVSILFPSRKIIRIIPILFILPISLFLSFNTFFTNSSKPVITAGTFWGFEYQKLLPLPENNKFERFIKNKLITSTELIANNALDRPTIYQVPYWTQVYYSSYDRLSDIKYLDPLIPDGATVYLNIPASALDYGLFDKQKDRKLFHVQSIEEVGEGYFITDSSSPVQNSKRVQEIGQTGSYLLYKISSTY